MSETERPAALAQAVVRELARRKQRPLPAEPLERLFDMLFFASMETEEGHALTMHVALIDPADPDPDRPARIVADRWSCVPLADRIPVSVPTLAKLARATDPRTSSFAIWFEGDRPYIWGLIDQGNRYYDFVNFDVEAGPQTPGVFQVSVLGIGRLVVSIRFEIVAELRIGELITRSVDVLRTGPVRDALDPGIATYLNHVQAAIDPGTHPLSRGWPFWELQLRNDWVATVCRILLRAQNYRHGGAILISSDETHPDLKVKYELPYSRLHSALVGRARARIDKTEASDAIFEQMDSDVEDVPMSLHLREGVAANLIEERTSELDGIIWFISLLTRVDGLVLMNKNLDVLGFGVEILTEEPPINVYVPSGPRATDAGLRRGDYQHYGTRHRSMMRYSAKHPGSVGFVISQDGHVRAVTSVRGRVVMWDNVRLQFTTFISQPKRVTGRRHKPGTGADEVG